MKKTIYYSSYEEDIIKNKNQDYVIKDNYKYIHNNIFYKLLSHFFHFIFIIVAFIYSKLYLRIKIVNKKILKKEKNYYLYSNHTLEFGDVFNPVLLTIPKHPYIICSPANLGIPVIGKILPLAGALPIPNGITKLKELKDAISHYINKNKCIVIYPEAHLWPYSTFIRPFNKSAFHFPVDYSAPVFVATTTYQKRKYLKRPKITIFVDGPFNIKDNLTRKENINYLHDIVHETMTNRAKSSNYEYIKYIKK
jgi:1-acyl-sn-glycerol-3-phosphate acyltransferase